jgi:hypothetical protein
VNRSDGFFRCPWCATRNEPGGSKTRLKSARAMEVSRLDSFSWPGPNPHAQIHLQTCSSHSPGVATAKETLAADPTHHPPGSPPEPREVVFSTEVTVFPTSRDQPTETEVIVSSPTFASALKMLEEDEGINPLDEEP